MRILKEQTVALVIDIQERLFPVIAQNEALLKNTHILIKGLQALEIPLLITEQYRKGLGETLPEIQAHFQPFKMTEKTSFSCCDDARFMVELEQLSKPNVLICGIESHVCVLQTVLDLLANGFVPVVVEDCVSSRKLSDKETALHRMRQEGAIVTTCESILFELARVSGTEAFKTISKLVK